ncbi:MAG: zf-TFIIB domain-containing protein [Candidatus Hydrothermales bacterium]
MKCPFCKIDLNKKKFKNFFEVYEITYQCFQCGGLFFEDISNPKKTKENNNLQEVYIPLLKACFPLQNRKNFSCPKCNKNMKKYLNPIHKEYIFLLCKKCNGLFLNKGKLSGLKDKKVISKNLKSVLIKKIEKENNFFPKENLKRLLTEEYSEFMIPFLKLPFDQFKNIFLTFLTITKYM